MKYRNEFFTISAIPKLLKSAKNFDVIHGMGRAALPAVLIKKALRRPVIYRCGGLNYLIANKKWILASIEDKLSAKLADYRITLKKEDIKSTCLAHQLHNLRIRT